MGQNHRNILENTKPSFFVSEIGKNRESKGALLDFDSPILSIDYHFFNVIVLGVIFINHTRYSTYGHYQLKSVGLVLSGGLIHRTMMVILKCGLFIAPDDRAPLQRIHNQQ